MLRTIDKLIDHITMYRLMLYYLVALLVLAAILGATGSLQYSPPAIIISALILVIACWIVNKAFAHFFNVPTNYESSLITALILALIITPKLGLYDITFLLAASGLAMASKYILTINNTHIFNPAAIAVVLTALGPRQNANWWVGTAALLPLVVIGGLLLMRKTRRERMVTTFFIVTFAATALYTLFSHGNIATGLQQAALTSPIFFLGFVMLTEPLTSPSTTRKQGWYGTLVGFLLPPQVHIFSLYSTPELALIIGNVFSYIVDPKVRLFPILKEKVKIAANTAEFVFKPAKKLAYQPGQYMEWTLPHEGVDARGNRHYFTLASSPTEPDLRLGVKFYEPSSSYKKSMLDMDKETQIVATQVSGDFTLPKNPQRKLAFIAGGIGITPFRSMIKYLIDKNERRDIVILYAANNAEDIAYRDILDVAFRQLEIKTFYILANTNKNNALVRPGHVDSRAIRELVPDYKERTFYLSGSQPMVASVKSSLNELTVSGNSIKIDYFPGYA